MSTYSQFSRQLGYYPHKDIPYPTMKEAQQTVTDATDLHSPVAFRQLMEWARYLSTTGITRKQWLILTTITNGFIKAKDYFMTN